MLFLLNKYFYLNLRINLNYVSSQTINLLQRVINNCFLIFFKQEIGFKRLIFEHLWKPDFIVFPHLLKRHIIVIEPFWRDLCLNSRELDYKDYFHKFSIYEFLKIYFSKFDNLKN